MTKAHAEIRISGARGLNVFHWSADVFGVECTKNWTFYKTTASAKRAAIRWCNRLGLPHTVTFDNGVKR